MSIEHDKLLVSLEVPRDDYRYFELEKKILQKDLEIEKLRSRLGQIMTFVKTIAWIGLGMLTPLFWQFITT